MKLLVVNNLSSGYRDGAIYDFIRAFAQAEDEVVLRTVDSNSSFASKLTDATEFDAVVAAGGDGTVASICYLLRYTNVPILPYPAGTANLVTQNLISPIEPFALAKLVREGKRLPFDQAEVETTEGNFGFTIMAGCGYDAKIMQDAKADKKRWGPAAYFRAAFANPNPQVAHISLDIDGQHYEHEGVGVLLINFSKIQFDISFTTENKPNDGLLDVLVLRTDTAWNLLPPVLGSAIDHSGKPLRDSNACVYYRGKEITIHTDPLLPVQYDGEPIDVQTPMRARVLPDATQLIISDEGYALFANK